MRFLDAIKNNKNYLYIKKKSFLGIEMKTLLWL